MYVLGLIWPRFTLIPRMRINVNNENIFSKTFKKIVNERRLSKFDNCIKYYSIILRCTISHFDFVDVTTRSTN